MTDVHGRIEIDPENPKRFRLSLWVDGTSVFHTFIKPNDPHRLGYLDDLLRFLTNHHNSPPTQE